MHDCNNYYIINIIHMHDCSSNVVCTLILTLIKCCVLNCMSAGSLNTAHQYVVSVLGIRI